MKIFSALGVFLLFSCAPVQEGDAQVNTSKKTVVTNSAQVLEKNPGLKSAYFASGCFWCVEAVFESVKGVEEAISGYAGGTTPNPTYQQVSAGQTDHAEAVEVLYDPAEVSYDELLEVYFGSHNITQKNGQGPDIGQQYRSLILVQDETERAKAEAYIKRLEGTGELRGEVAAEVVELTRFWPAEEYHQDYEVRNPNNPYVQRVSIPRLKAFQESHPHLLKSKKGE